MHCKTQASPTSVGDAKGLGQVPHLILHALQVFSGMTISDAPVRSCELCASLALLMAPGCSAFNSRRPRMDTVTHLCMRAHTHTLWTCADTFFIQHDARQ